MNLEYVNKFLELGFTKLNYYNHAINGIELENDNNIKMLFIDMEYEYNKLVYFMLDIVQIEHDDIEFSHYYRDENDDVWAYWYESDKGIKITSDNYEDYAFRFIKDILNKTDYKLLLERYETEKDYQDVSKANDLNYEGLECNFILEDWIGNIIKISEDLTILLDIQDDDEEEDLTIYYIDRNGNAKSLVY